MITIRTQPWGTARPSIGHTSCPGPPAQKVAPEFVLKKCSTWWDGALVLEPGQTDCTAVGQDLAICGVHEGVPVEGAVAAG